MTDDARPPTKSDPPEFEPSTPTRRAPDLDALGLEALAEVIVRRKLSLDAVLGELRARTVRLAVARAPNVSHAAAWLQMDRKTLTRVRDRGY